jgi:uncharacterized membrane protein YkvI
MTDKNFWECHGLDRYLIDLYKEGVYAMKRANWVQAFQIGFTYIGTVVGAGFASGQEIMQFFTLHGIYSYFGIAFATLLFAWGGNRLLQFGHDMRSISYNKLTEHVLGKRAAFIIDSIFLVMLFGVTVAMLAGVGALFNESLHLNAKLGAIITIVLTILVLNFGMNGILSANSIIVPCMFGFTVLIFLKSLHAGIQIPFTTGGVESNWKWTLSSISYAALNLGLAVSVLIPLGAEINNKRTLKLGGWIGSIGLGLMMMIIHISISARMPDILLKEVPMGHIASTMDPWIQYCFISVLWGEIFSTLIGNVYGLSNQLSNRPSSKQNIFLSICILVIAFFVSQVGFSNIVMYVYPLFGYLSFLLIAAMLFPNVVRKFF